MAMKEQNNKDYYKICGYVNVVGRESRPIKDKDGKRYIEVMAPGSFKRALSHARDVSVDVNHKSNQHIGSLSEKNLTLYEDSIGLYGNVAADREKFDKISDINYLWGWSFKFYPCYDSIDYDVALNGMPRRIINDFELESVSIIDKLGAEAPYYTGTSIEARSEGRISAFIRPSNAPDQFKIKKVFFNDIDMKKIKADVVSSSLPTAPNGAKNEVDFRKKLISEIFNSIKRRK